MTDPIADMLTRIRNAITARHDYTDVPASKVKAELARVLKQEGFIRDYELVENGTRRAVRIHIAYGNKKQPMVEGLQRVSKPGLRVYAQKQEIPRVYGGFGIAILSTPQGMMTGQDAWRKGVGGEVLCYVW
jgi:small subunit ribosomal protein S8